MLEDIKNKLIEKLKNGNLTCGTCDHWIENNPDIAADKTLKIGRDKMGVCMGAPPTPCAVGQQQGQVVFVNVYPTLPAQQPICGLYENIAAEDLNVQLKTQ